MSKRTTPQIGDIVIGICKDEDILEKEYWYQPLNKGEVGIIKEKIGSYTEIHSELVDEGFYGDDEEAKYYLEVRKNSVAFALSGLEVYKNEYESGPIPFDSQSFKIIYRKGKPFVY